jgi:hypothetical protein
LLFLYIWMTGKFYLFIYLFIYLSFSSFYSSVNEDIYKKKHWFSDTIFLFSILFVILSFIFLPLRIEYAFWLFALRA